MPYTAHFAPETLTRAETDALQGPVVLEFGTNWCGHCSRAQPVVAEALAQAPQVSHIKVEDGPGRALGRSYRVKLWPTLVFLRDGREVARTVRPASSADVRAGLDAITAAPV